MPKDNQRDIGTSALVRTADYWGDKLAHVVYPSIASYMDKEETEKGFQVDGNLGDGNFRRIIRVYFYTTPDGKRVKYTLDNYKNKDKFKLSDPVAMFVKVPFGKLTNTENSILIKHYLKPGRYVDVTSTLKDIPKVKWQGLLRHSDYSEMMSFLHGLDRMEVEKLYEDESYNAPFGGGSAKAGYEASGGVYGLNKQHKINFIIDKSRS